LGISWTVLGFASAGHSKNRKSMPRRREGRRNGFSVVGYGGSPQGNTQKMQWIMKKYNVV